MKKIMEMEGINFICTDEVSKDDMTKVESTISLMKKIFSNSSSVINLIEDAITQGLTKVIFTPKDENTLLGDVILNIIRELVL